MRVEKLSREDFVLNEATHGFFYQTSILCKRSIVHSLRIPAKWKARFVQVSKILRIFSSKFEVALGLISGAIFWKLSDNFEGDPNAFFNRIGALFFLTLNMFLMSFMETILSCIIVFLDLFKSPSSKRKVLIFKRRKC